MGKPSVSYRKDPATGEPLANVNGVFTAPELITVLHELVKMRNTKQTDRGSESQIRVLSGVSSQDLTGQVTLESDHLDSPVQLTSAQALELGHNLVEASQISTQEALLCGFLKYKMDFDQETVARMLYGLRIFREEMEKEDDSTNI